ncbi:hypothetical protein NPX13_g949 [Xylaria arbuscula]|uniref:Uncharacterized protein n=1 Tax=Xylaria arbuscula TaxID=114810 RepID=A0A9W8NNG6_9PEZI|nr:hypothetical protein NPX13_g949 [Xylaria arbuscula]
MARSQIDVNEVMAAARPSMRKKNPFKRWLSRFQRWARKSWWRRKERRGGVRRPSPGSSVSWQTDSSSGSSSASYVTAPERQVEEEIQENIDWAGIEHEHAEHPQPARGR